MKTITKSVIAGHIQDKFGFSKNYADSLVTNIFKKMTDLIESDSKLNIPKLGTFEVYQKKARPGMNISKGEKITISARKIVRFIPSRSLKEKING